MNRRNFIASLGVFTILPGAGRVWKAERKVVPVCVIQNPQRVMRYAICTDEVYNKFLQSLNVEEFFNGIKRNHPEIFKHFRTLV